jgi:hypothetical protein
MDQCVSRFSLIGKAQSTRHDAANFQDVPIGLEDAPSGANLLESFPASILPFSVIGFHGI